MPGHLTVPTRPEDITSTISIPHNLKEEYPTVIFIDKTTCMELLDKAVAERGEEYIYASPVKSLFGEPKCVYVDTSTGERRPSCLVALVLYMAGVPLSKLEIYENVPARTMLKGLSDQNVIKSTPVVREALNKSQREQDMGSTWRSARASAEFVFSNQPKYRGSMWEATNG